MKGYRIYRNGTLVETKDHIVTQSTQSSWDAVVIKGNNIFKVIAYDYANNESEAATITIVMP